MGTRHWPEDADDEVERLEGIIKELRQQLAEKDAEIESLIGKNQNLFNALMASTQKKDNLYQSIRSASGHLNLYGLFSCVEGDSYDQECADKNARKANSILRAELTTEVINPAGKEDQAVYDSIARNYLEAEQPSNPELRAGIALQLKEIERLRHGLENCRLLAARNRKESWALLILGFCAEAGVVGSITRDYPNADCHGPDWTDRDGEYLK